MGEHHQVVSAQSVFDPIEKANSKRMIQVSGRAHDDPDRPPRMQNASSFRGDFPQRHDLRADREDQVWIFVDTISHVRTFAANFRFEGRLSLANLPDRRQ